MNREAVNYDSDLRRTQAHQASMNEDEKDNKNRWIMWAREGASGGDFSLRTSLPDLLEAARLSRWPNHRQAGRAMGH